MLNPRALAAAVVATGAGAVLFLGTASEPARPEPATGGPVPVAIPPVATEVPTTHPAIPAAVPERPTAAPKPVDTPKPPPATRKPAGRAAQAPKKAQVTPRQQPSPSTPVQPQPAGVEPNGSGGWQLPACYDVACQETAYAANPCTGTGTECLDSTLGQLGIANPVPGLIGGR